MAQLRGGLLDLTQRCRSVPTGVKAAFCHLGMQLRSKTMRAVHELPWHTSARARLAGFCAGVEKGC